MRDYFGCRWSKYLVDFSATLFKTIFKTFVRKLNFCLREFLSAHCTKIVINNVNDPHLGLVTGAIISVDSKWTLFVYKISFWYLQMCQKNLTTLIWVEFLKIILFASWHQGWRKIPGVWSSHASKKNVHFIELGAIQMERYLENKEFSSVEINAFARALVIHGLVLSFSSYLFEFFESENLSSRSNDVKNEVVNEVNVSKRLLLKGVRNRNSQSLSK